MKNTYHTQKKSISNLFSKKGLLALITGILISTATFAKAGETPVTTDAGNAAKTIREHIKFPNFNIYQAQEEKVNVVFTVNENGQVNLVIANTSNAILKKTIEDQFLKLTLKQLKANNAYSIQFNFKTI